VAAVEENRIRHAQHEADRRLIVSCIAGPHAHNACGKYIFWTCERASYPHVYDAMHLAGFILQRKTQTGYGRTTDGRGIAQLTIGIHACIHVHFPYRDHALAIMWRTHRWDTHTL
jgi:hypothetical protein